jgi:hypothetical protein
MGDEQRHLDLGGFAAAHQVDVHVEKAGNQVLAPAIDRADPGPEAAACPRFDRSHSAASDEHRLIRDDSAVLHIDDGDAGDRQIRVERLHRAHGRDAGNEREREAEESNGAMDAHGRSGSRVGLTYEGGTAEFRVGAA